MEDRVILLLTDLSGSLTGEIGGHGFWERLGDTTGIASKRWRQVYGRKQRITSDMLQALSQCFPTYAFWLSTGITDAVNGHCAPNTALTFPERLHLNSESDKKYFRESLELVKTLYSKGNIDPDDEKQRMFAVERICPMAHWIASPLLDLAYELSTSEPYQQLQKIREQRERDRNELLMRMEQKPIAEHQTSTAKARRTSFSGIDDRTTHQSLWELFYRPADDNQEN